MTKILISMPFYLIAIACFIGIAIANKKMYDNGERPDKGKMGALGGIGVLMFSIALIISLIL